MCMCVPYFILLTTVCWLLSLCFSNTFDTSQFEGIMEKFTSLDVDNLTYLDGCCLFGFCELKEDSQFTVLWFLQEQDHLSLVFLLCSTQLRLLLCFGECIT